MSFLSRAQKSYDRGDKVRAVVTLIEGLKRQPDNAAALDLLLDLYGIEVDGLGLENDVVKIVELQPDADDLLSVLVDNARGCGHARVADTLLELGEARGIQYVAASTEVERPPQDDAADSEVASDSKAGGFEDADDDPGVPPVEDSPLPNELLADIDELGESSVPEDVSPTEESGAGEPGVQTGASSEASTDMPRQVADASGGTAASAESGAADRASGSKSKRRPKRGRPEREGRPLRRRYLVIATILMVVGVGAWLAFRQVQHVAAVAQVEAAITVVSPDSLGELESELSTLETRWRKDEEVAARIAFGRAYAAWSVGDDSASVDPTGDSAWAAGAMAVDAVRQGNLEVALEMVTRAERLDAAAIPSLMARAIVEESRGRWQSADKAWAELVERDPDVIPAYEGRARIAWRRLEEPALVEALGALERRRPNHPYLVMASLIEPVGSVPKKLEFKGQSRFIRVLERFASVRRAYARGDDAAAQEGAFWLAGREKGGVAALQQGVVFAANYKVDEARSAFERAAMTQGMNRALRTRLQTMAPMALTGMGRPDLSEPFETTVPGKTPREDVERRLPAMRRSAIEHVRESDWAVRALFAHADAIAQRGEFEAAIDLYEHLEAREVDPDRARWEASLLRLSHERARNPPNLTAESEDVWRAARAFLSGDFDEVNTKTTLPVSGPLGQTARTYQIKSLIASRRVPVALQLLDEERGTISARADGLTLRAWARRGRDNQRFATLYERLVRVEPVGVDRLADLASAAFWQGKPREAEGFADALLAKVEGHREANWIKGLILRQDARFNEAETYLRRSGRDWDDSSGLLVELGHVNLALQNWEEARKNFYRAFLLNRENIEAVSGLGEAYARGGSEVGLRDMSRIGEGLPTTDRFAPIRGEVSRWLSVLKGVREGNQEALGFLEAAIKEVGRRPDLLVEMARYHEARGELDEARKHYASALQGNTTLASAHLGLARMALKDGDESVARDHLQRYLEVEPRGDGANWARKRLEALEEEQ